MSGRPGLDAPGPLVLDESTIRERVRALGVAIAADYRDRNPLLVGVLTSAAVFLADLVRELPIACELDLIALSHHPATGLRFEKDVGVSIEGRHVVLVDDIVDSGATLHYVIQTFEARAPATLAVCLLLDRPHRRAEKLPILYRGFEISERFVVGYGLDDRGRYRELPALHAPPAVARRKLPDRS